MPKAAFPMEFGEYKTNGLSKLYLPHHIGCADHRDDFLSGRGV